MCFRIHKHFFLPSKLLFFCTAILLLSVSSCLAGSQSNPPSKVNVIIIGDRVVDIAYNLGIAPTAISVRGSMWKKSDSFKMASKMLGCPGCITSKAKHRVPDAIKKYGIKTIVVEKNPHYCLYRPDIKPESIAQIVEGMGVELKYVDFSNGVESAIKQTGALFNKEKEAETLINTYTAGLAKVKAATPKQPLNKKVVILNGVYQSETGKSFLRVETTGGYSDKYLLNPLGCINVGNELTAKKKVDKGHITVRSLAKLMKVKPDVIVITGDPASVQKKLHLEIKKNPEFALIPALKNQAVFSLPRYVDSGVIEYPGVFSKWANILSE